QVVWLPRHMVACSFDRVEISPDGRRLAILSAVGVLLLDLKAGRVSAVCGGRDDRFHAVAFSPDGQTLATVSEVQRLQVWDPSNGACRATYQGAGSREFYAVAWAPNGTELATSELDGPVRLWDACPGRARPLTRDHIWGTRLLWRPDGLAVAVLGHPQSWLVVDRAGAVLFRDGQPRRNLGAARFGAAGQLAGPPAEAS